MAVRVPSPPGPLRTCVGCRRVVPAAELVRFVCRGAVVAVDPSRTAPGRGAWLHPDVACIGEARRRGGFARSLRRRVDDAVLDGFAGAVTADDWVGWSTGSPKSYTIQRVSSGTTPGDSSPATPAVGPSGATS